MSLRALAACAVVAALVMASRHAGWMERLDLVVFDWASASLVSEQNAREHVAVVTADESDIQRLGRWPLSDGAVADALTRLLAAGALAVGLDIYRDIPVPPGHGVLNELLAREPRIVVVNKLGDARGSGGVAPPAELAGSGRVGFADMLVDGDGRVRRALLYASDARGTHASLGVLLGEAWLASRDVRPQPASNGVRFGSATLAPLAARDGGYAGVDARGYQTLLDFGGRLDSYTLGDVLDGRAGTDQFVGRVVVFGVDAASVKDNFSTPARTHAESGAALHARVAAQLIAAGAYATAPRRGASPWLGAAFVLLSALLGGAAARFGRRPARALPGAAGGLAICAAATVGAWQLGWWLPGASAAAACGLAFAAVLGIEYARERRERETLRRLFDAQLSTEVAARIWAERDDILEHGRLRPRAARCTTLFSDLEGFSGHASSLDIDALMAMVERYTSAMTDLVIEHGGVVDDYAGDGIKASFGLHATPGEQQADQARNAVECALAMRAAVAGLCEQWAAQGLPPMRARVGLNTGDVIIGTIGSRQRMKYTSVGDSVNVAARLEGFECESAWDGANKVRIVLAESTRQHLGEGFALRPLGAVALKGQPAPVTAFAVLDGPS